MTLNYHDEMDMSDGDWDTNAPHPPAKGKERRTVDGGWLDPRDPGNFLKLASALNLFLADSLTDADIDKADQLICEYNVELIEVC